MNMPQEHKGEHERREGLGGRVRRFVDTELSRIRDKGNEGAATSTDHPRDPDPADRGGIVDRVDSSSVQETPVQETRQSHELDQGTNSEPVDHNAGGPGNADRPATTVTPDAGPEPTLQPTRPEEFRGQSGDQPAAEGSAAGRSGDQPIGEGSAARVGLLKDVASLRDEWQRVQGTFVDDPQRAVHEASVLVERMLDEIRVNVGSERPSETMSTEDLRVSFQRYREFFQRLLSA